MPMLAVTLMDAVDAAAGIGRSYRLSSPALVRPKRWLTDTSLNPPVWHCLSLGSALAHSHTHTHTHTHILTQCIRTHTQTHSANTSASQR
ncbi:hypothetical protein CGRA01v4_07826 [Colletotrichum graminicola]|nr:hypothetical protein CGRA01v4_07826 [Colletotrichum graminicola]